MVYKDDGWAAYCHTGKTTHHKTCKILMPMYLRQTRLKLCQLAVCHGILPVRISFHNGPISPSAKDGGAEVRLKSCVAGRAHSRNTRTKAQGEEVRKSSCEASLVTSPWTRAEMVGPLPDPPISEITRHQGRQKGNSWIAFSVLPQCPSPAPQKKRIGRHVLLYPASS